MDIHWPSVFVRFFFWPDLSHVLDPEFNRLSARHGEQRKFVQLQALQNFWFSERVGHSQGTLICAPSKNLWTNGLSAMGFQNISTVLVAQYIDCVRTLGFQPPLI